MIYNNAYNYNHYWVYDRNYLIPTHITKLNIMEIPAINEEDEEMSFDLNICCCQCSSASFVWNEAQHNKIVSSAKNGDILKVPKSVDNEDKFIAYIRSL